MPKRNEDYVKSLTFVILLIESITTIFIAFSNKFIAIKTLFLSNLLLTLFTKRIVIYYAVAKTMLKSRQE